MSLIGEKSVIKDCYGVTAECVRFVSVETIEHLRSVLCKFRGRDIKIVGSFTNMILAHCKLNRIIIKLDGAFSNIQLIDNQRVRVGSSVKIPSLLNFCLKSGLGGLEFMVGIPGTVGGAIYCNAGAFGNEIGDYIQEITCMDREGDIKKFKKRDINFSYRNSGLRGYIILDAVIRVSPFPEVEIKNKMQRFFFRRLQSQDYYNSSCGCFFRNPPGACAGGIIEDLNLKSRKRAGAWVSEKHGNFILSDGDVHPQDILAIKDVIQRKVWRERRIWFNPEVEILW
ncbi:MAG: UDP-N-acetylenolpyruvoylglucosamine reductase [Candidatus Omnitrophica bacterium 4484_49]|nr:MAG: UDP-N-acetylenolpyruvoylglucosamine reductase [Candidatus Omnitrophica bacterium 4484_49]